LPAFTWFYGLTPWDMERLTFGEIDSYTRWMNAYLEAQKG